MGNYSSNSWSTSDVIRQFDPFKSLEISPMSRADAITWHELASTPTPDEVVNESCAQVGYAVDPGTTTALVSAEESYSVATRTLVESLVAPVTRLSSVSLKRELRIEDDVGDVENVAKQPKMSACDVSCGMVEGL